MWRKALYEIHHPNEFCQAQVRGSYGRPGESLRKRIEAKALRLCVGIQFYHNKGRWRRVVKKCTVFNPLRSWLPSATHTVAIFLHLPPHQPFLIIKSHPCQLIDYREVRSSKLGCHNCGAGWEFFLVFFPRRFSRGFRPSRT